MGNYTVHNHTMSDAQMLIIQSRFEARLLEQDRKIADQQKIIADLNKCMLVLLEKKVQGSAGALTITHVNSQQTVDAVSHREDLFEKVTGANIGNLEYGMSQIKNTLALLQEHREMLPATLQNILPIDSKHTPSEQKKEEVTASSLSGMAAVRLLEPRVQRNAYIVTVP